MAIAQNSRNLLKVLLRSGIVGEEVGDVIDAGSGTLSQHARDRMRVGLANNVIADSLCDSIDAGTALTGAQQNLLGLALGSRVAAQDIATEMA